MSVLSGWVYIDVIDRLPLSMVGMIHSWHQIPNVRNGFRLSGLVSEHKGDLLLCFKRVNRASLYSYIHDIFEHLYYFVQILFITCGATSNSVRTKENLCNKLLSVDSGYNIFSYLILYIS